MSLDDYLKAAGPYAQDILAARSEFLRIRLNLQPEIRKIYARAADRLAREIRALPRTGHDLTRDYLRALETALRKEAGQLNADLTASLRSTIEQSVAAGLKPHARITTKLLQQASIGLNVLQAQWAFAAVNTRAVEAIWARARNGLRLSDRIWNIAGRNMDAIRDVILDSVTMGRDAVKVARDLEQYLKVKTPVTEFPNMMKRMGKRIPKDITYEALRLARTEMTSAFGEGTIAGGHATASYRGIRWVLSAAHPEPDVCDELAHGGPGHDGVYPRGQEPAYPAHPNELCILLPQHEKPDDFVKRLREWRDNSGAHPDIDRWYNEVYKVAYTGSQGPAPTAATPPSQNTGLSLGARRTLVKGYSLQGNNVRDVVVYSGKDGVRLITPVDLDASLQTLTIEDVREALYRLPTRLRKLIDEVQILDYANPDDPYWEQKYNIPKFRSFATGGGRSIQFYTNGYNSKQSNLDYLPKALNHEAGHLLDQALAKRSSSRFSDSPIWSVARTSDTTHNLGIEWTSEYARLSQSVHEDFADAVDLWLRSADVMRERFPYRTRILSREVKIRGR